MNLSEDPSAAPAQSQAPPGLALTDAPVSFHPLSFVPERNADEVLVGRPDSESFAVFDAEDADLLRRMTEGMPPDEAAAWYQATYGQAVDIRDFLATLTDLDFVRRDGEQAAATRAVGLQWLGRILFSRIAFGVLVVVAVAWILVFAKHPEIAPNPRQVFFTHSLLAVQLAVLFLQLPWIALHEAAHVLAGRRLGLPSRLSVSTRLYFVVFETRMNGLLTLPRRKRFTPILAGMAVDVFVISALGLLAFSLSGPSGAEPLVSRVLLAMTFPILVRLGYQFLLFLRTDLYFVVATALGCHDLHAAAQALIRNHLWRLLRRPDRMADEDQWTEGDRRIARWYAPFFAVGAVALIVIGVLVVIPIVVRTAHLLAQGLSLSPSHGQFWDSILFAVLNLAQFLLLTLVVVLRRIHSRRSPAHAERVGSQEVLGRGPT